MANRPSVSPTDQIIKDNDRGYPALTKWFYGFDYRLVLGHTEDLKMVVVAACVPISMKYV